MVEKVEMFKTNDGRYFEERREANEHEFSVSLEHELTKLLTNVCEFPASLVEDIVPEMIQHKNDFRVLFDKFCFKYNGKIILNSKSKNKKKRKRK